MYLSTSLVALFVLILLLYDPVNRSKSSDCHFLSTSCRPSVELFDQCKGSHQTNYSGATPSIYKVHVHTIYYIHVNLNIKVDMLLQTFDYLQIFTVLKADRSICRWTFTTDASFIVGYTQPRYDCSSIRNMD